MEWKPIETAPKDGSEFLCLFEGEYFVAWWHSPDDEFVWMQPGLFTWDDDVYVRPQHWMPLPPSPEAD